MASVIGVLHPGAMGCAVGRCLVDRGLKVLWASEGRSEASAARAQSDGFTDAGTVAELCRQAEVIISVCPPASAESVAKQVCQDFAFKGTYVDANAVSPATAHKIAELASGARYVDGGIIGGPPRTPGSTRLYLSGNGAADVASLFEGTPLGAQPLQGRLTAASALKMAYAAWTKGSSALLLNVRALAEAEGVSEALEAEWNLSQPGVAERARKSCGTVGPKAWRFEGEMHEIGDTFAAAGLPDGFHRGSAEVYRRLAPLKGREGDPPSLEEALTHLVQRPSDL